MHGLMDKFALPLLRALDAEKAHQLTVAALERTPLPAPRKDNPCLQVTAFGLTFPNPLGIAAGFDKDARVPDQLLKLGFGFAEIGTVTPRPQPGNPRPRLFRLEPDRGIINRFGFNSEGHAAALRRLRARAGKPGVIGVNLGANKESEDRTADYVAGVHAFADVAHYFTINISSPNTPGLRNLQHAQALDDLLARCLEARDMVAQTAKRRPILLKIAPDLTLEELDDVIGIARARHIDGLIVSNTTLSRPDTLSGLRRYESGGLSGRPLQALSTRMLAEAFLRVEGQFPLIGVGGVDGPQAAWMKILAGGSLIQLYSALVYEGIGLVDHIKTGLTDALHTENTSSLAPLVGSRAADIVAGKLDM